MYMTALGVNVTISQGHSAVSAAVGKPVKPIKGATMRVHFSFSAGAVRLGAAKRIPDPNESQRAR